MNRPRDWAPSTTGWPSLACGAIASGDDAAAWPVASTEVHARITRWSGPPGRIAVDQGRSDALVFFGATGDLAYKELSRRYRGWSRSS
jgi:hypothetical protein